MISRVAENCFWMSRYLERAENTARVLDVNQTLLLDFDVPVEQQWKPLLIISGIHDPAVPTDAEGVQNHLTWETANPSSIVNCVAFARENARTIREVISTEMWERINFYYLWMQGPAARALYDRSRSEFYKTVKEINQTFHGITDGTMSHGQAWDFIQLGKYLERASQTSRIVDVKYHILLPDPEMVGNPIDNAHWTAVLKSCSGYEPYHKHQRGLDAAGVSVAAFLLFDQEFPRSVRRCLVECRLAAHAISGRHPDRPGNEAEKELDSLVSWMHLANVDDFVKFGLHDALTDLINRIHRLGDAIHRTYFDFRFEMPAVTAPADSPKVVSVELKPQGAAAAG
jgi:uncharacterized alpha-E superfamily protein